MKTFKVISLQVIENGEKLQDIDIVDGLIINKEDKKGTWLIETCITKDYYDLFHKFKQSEEGVEVQVVISYPENNPASFITKIRVIKVMDNHLSIMFEGRLKSRRNEYAELLLDDLVQKGLNGDTLVNEFRVKMKSKPRLLAAAKQKD